jgi:sugar/nucleoside kinase (ribokinase family)
VWRLGVVGNLSRDVVDGRPPRVGGGPFHCARALHRLATRAVVVTKCAESDRAALLPRLVALGLPVEWRPAAATAAFSMSYSDGERAMTMDAVGDAWTPDDARGWVADALGRAVWVHVAALARSDFPPETLAELARGRRISLDGQGLVRNARTGPLALDGDFDPAVLDQVSVLKLAEEEYEAIGREPAEFGVPEVLVTRGARGSHVWAGGRLEEVPARPVDPRFDPTGAGDAFIAAYLDARCTGHPPASAAKRATAVVAAVLAGRAL